jgi:hypothetical protein
VTATIRATPRMAWSAATTGAIDQLGSSSSICWVSRSSRAFGVLDGVNVILQHNLLRRMGKAYSGQPAAIGQRPTTSPSIYAIVAQQEALQMLACLGQDPARRRPCSNQVTHGFMGGVGHPDRCQLAGTVKLGQHHRVAPIGLHPVARLDWDQRRSHHNALMPTAGQRPVQPITTRAAFVAKAQPTTPSAQLGCQLHQKLGTVLENPIWRTLPSRPLSASAMQSVALCTSNPT